MRLTGHLIEAILYQAGESDYKRTDKYVGRTKDVFTLTSLLRDFFSSSKTGKIHIEIINNVIEQLQKIKNIIIELGNSIKL